MTLAFSLKHISKTYGDDQLFVDLSIDFKFNEQMGIIGNNGTGKSTLLKIMAGQTLPDDGEVVVKKGLRVVYLAQEDRFDPELSVEEVLHNSLQPYGFDDQDIHQRVHTALKKGLFPSPEIKCSRLSGGWKKKLAIVRALCCEPDVLLMDEPTNHLDINGILWLEDLLKNARFSFILVSHDRAFLDSVCRNIVEIGRYYPSGFFKIQGTYSQFDRQREKFLIAQEKQQQSLTSKMRREDEWLRQGPKARTSKAKFRIDQAYAIREQVSRLKQLNQQNAKLDIDFHATGRKTKRLIRAFQIGKQVHTEPLFKDITFEIGPGQCMGIVGVNGSGKSTLLSIFEKTITPDSGKVDWAQDLKISVFDQQRLALNPEDTLRDALNPAGGDSVNYKGRSIHIVTWAKRFLFMPDQLDMPVKRLSGGEKARIMIGKIMLSPCDVLLLDEPTNDLDILSLQVLEQSIRQFSGAVIIVSHDRYLMDRVCQQMLYLDPGKEALFFRDFSQILKHRKTGAAVVPPKRTKPPAKPERAKKKRPFSYKDKFELAHIEEDILAAEDDVETYSSKIQEPDVINDPQQMEAFCQKLKDAQEKVSFLYDRWEILEQKKADAEQA